ncbi:MAG: GNAT family N-acetyltransferase [Gordonia sp. (in: high G+C Gram-positive bacteria)]|jgi:ribosomal protein S18 acetylase RimI-like enzyme|nr:GNAT family N-acetyltransferase [Gordonia sp. (in: high G+C Gram-positive bacteria)]
MTAVDTSILDNPAFAALNGPHSRFAERVGRAVRYPSDVSPFTAIPPEPTADDWADLATLVGPGGVAAFGSPSGVTPPSGWSVAFEGAGAQYVGDRVDPIRDERSLVLTAADVPEILDLINRTEPGPFLARTVELGTYLGIRQHGALVAVAGERLTLPGWTEISAVCTDPAARGQGLATALVRHVAANIVASGSTPFLHVAATNPARRLYEDLGFTLRAEVVFTALTAPSP